MICVTPSIFTLSELPFRRKPRVMVDGWGEASARIDWLTETSFWADASPLLSVAPPVAVGVAITVADSVGVT